MSVEHGFKSPEPVDSIKEEDTSPKITRRAFINIIGAAGIGGVMLAPEDLSFGSFVKTPENTPENKSTPIPVPQGYRGEKTNDPVDAVPYESGN